MWYQRNQLVTADGLHSSIGLKDITPQTAQELWRENKEKNRSLLDIGREKGVNRNTLQRAFHQQNLPIQKVPPSQAYNNNAQKAKDIKQNSPQLYQRIVELGRANQSVQQISQDVSQPSSVVFYVLKLDNQSPNYQASFSHDDIQRMLAMFREGKTINAIAAAFGSTNQNIDKTILRNLSPDERKTYRDKMLAKKGPEFQAQVQKILEAYEQPGASYTNVSSRTGIPIHIVKRVVENFSDSKVGA
jgi:DNA invertase Pin-like site-specific DNA recombinase